MHYASPKVLSLRETKSGLKAECRAVRMALQKIIPEFTKIEKALTKNGPETETVYINSFGICPMNQIDPDDTQADRIIKTEWNTYKCDKCNAPDFVSM